MLKLANNLDLPIDFATERIAFLARTGSGKSGGMRVEFEQFFDAGIFSIFVDPKGDAWGIRADGVKKGKPVLIMGGDHGDIPLEPSNGRTAAEFLVRERVSTVVDISDFGHKEMWRFGADFMRTLYKLNRDVAHLFIDEIDMLAGKEFYDPNCLQGIQQIQNKGRGRGWGFTAASQRPQLVNNTVLNASGTYVVMQTIGDDALKVVKRLLGQSCSREVVVEIMSQLPTLQKREAFVYSPQTLGIEPRRITFNEFQTFDSMKTPKPGETRQQPKSLADIDLSAVQRDMAATIEKVKAEDPRTLKAEVAKLRRELDQKQKEIPQAITETVEVEVPVIPQEFRDELLAIGSKLIDVGQLLNKIDDMHLDSRVRLNKLLENVNDYATRPSGRTPNTNTQSSPRPASKAVNTPLPSGRNSPNHSPVRPTPKLDGDIQLNKTQHRILDAIAWWESIGIASPTSVQIGAVALVDPTGGHFSNIVGPLSSNELIVRESGKIRLTAAGRAIAQIPENASSLEDFHNILRTRVRKMKQASGRTIDILNVIIEADGQSLKTEEIGERVGIDHTGGHFSNTIGPLSTAGLITRSSGLVTPTNVLFPEGLY